MGISDQAYCVMFRNGLNDVWCENNSGRERWGALDALHEARKLQAASEGHPSCKNFEFGVAHKDTQQSVLPVKKRVDLSKVTMEPVRTPTTGDAKIGQAEKKPPLALIAASCLTGASRVKGYGAKKYQPGNWHKAALADGAGARYISALLRHVGSMQEPNGLHTAASLAALDEESGLPHIDHAICGLLMLRGILIKEKALAEDPGIGNEPPTVAK